MPLRAVHLVAGDAHQVDIHRPDVDRDLADRLGGVDVQQRPGGVDQLRRRRDRLDRADLVVDRHQRDDRRRPFERGLERLQVGAAVRSNRQDRDLEAFVLKGSRGFEHAFVLGREGKDTGDAVAEALAEARRAHDGEIVGLRGAGGEDEFAGLGANQVCDLRARSFDRRLRLLAEAVLDRMRIAENLLQERQHGVERARIERRRRLVIEVDRCVRVRCHGRAGSPAAPSLKATWREYSAVQA